MCVQNFKSVPPSIVTFLMCTHNFSMGALGACNFRQNNARDLKIGRYHHENHFYVCAKFQVPTTMASYYFQCAHTDDRTTGRPDYRTYRS